MSDIDVKTTSDFDVETTSIYQPKTTQKNPEIMSSFRRCFLVGCLDVLLTLYLHGCLDIRFFDIIFVYLVGYFDFVCWLKHDLIST